MPMGISAVKPSRSVTLSMYPPGSTLTGTVAIVLNLPSELTVAVVQLKSAFVGLFIGLSRRVTWLDGLCINCEKFAPVIVTSVTPILAAIGLTKT